MKNLVFATLTICVLAPTLSTYTMQPNAINALQQEPHITSRDLTINDYAKLCLFTSLSAGLGWIFSQGFAQALHTPQVTTLGTFAATVAGALWTYKSLLPHEGWTTDDRDLLNCVITASSEQELLAQLDSHFIKVPANRAHAFDALVKLNEKLENAEAILTKINTNNCSALIALRCSELITLIQANKLALEKALLVLKAQPTWVSELSVYTLGKIKADDSTEKIAGKVEYAVLMAHDCQPKKHCTTPY